MRAAESPREFAEREGGACGEILGATAWTWGQDSKGTEEGAQWGWAQSPRKGVEHEVQSTMSLH